MFPWLLKEVKDLAEMAVKIEKHYGRPMEPRGAWPLGFSMTWMVVI